MKSWQIIYMWLLIAILPTRAFTQATLEKEIYSGALKEKRKLWISLPEHYSLRKDSFHLVFVLDGNNKTFFDLTVASKRFLEANAVDLNDFNTPEAIIVGIGQKNRATDFVDSAADFLKFLSDELIPFVTKTYRTKPYTILIGHSLAGRFAIYSMIKKPKLFNAIITASPAYSSKFINAIDYSLDSLFNVNNFPDRSWFLSTSYLNNDNTEKQFRPFAEAMRSYFTNKDYRNLRFAFNSSATLGHAKTPYFSITEGLHFIYDPSVWYLSTDTITSIFKEKTNSAQYLERYSQRIYQRFGVSPSLERWTGFIAFQLTNQNKIDEAKTVLKKQLDLNPTNLDLYFQLLDLMKKSNDKGLLKEKNNFVKTLKAMKLPKEEYDLWISKGK